LKTVSLGDAIELAYGKNLPVQERYGGSVPVYGSNGVVGYHDKAVLSEPTVIIGRKGSAGAVHLTTQPSYPIDTTYFVRIRPGVMLDIGYVYYALKYLNLSRLRTETGVPGLNRNDVYREQFPLPILSEQKLIVGVMDKAAKIVKLQQKFKNNLQEFVSSHFDKIFGDQIHNSMRYDIHLLGELCQIDRQSVRPDNTAAQNIPFVGVENVEPVSGILNLHSSSRVGSRKSAAYLFDKRHILYSKLRPYLNKVAIPDFSGTCSTELVPLIVKNGVNREYIAHFLRRKTTVDAAMSSVTGSRMPRADMNKLLALPVPLPPLSEQQEGMRTLNQAINIRHLQENSYCSSADLTSALLCYLLKHFSS